MFSFLLDVPELMAVVADWDREVRSRLEPTTPWFAPLFPDTGGFDPGLPPAGQFRVSRVNKDLKAWLSKVGLPYHSPHKLRHGHAVYALKNARDISDLKAISQNLMHSNLSITDGVYGVLSNLDVRTKITGLGRTQPPASGSTSELRDLVRQILAEL